MAWDDDPDGPLHAPTHSLHTRRDGSRLIEDWSQTPGGWTLIELCLLQGRLAWPRQVARPRVETCV